MRRILATVLAGCLALQPLSACTMTVCASEQTIASMQESTDDTVNGGSGMESAVQEDTVPGELQPEESGQQSGTVDTSAADVQDASQQGGPAADPSSGTDMQEAVPEDGSFDALEPDLTGDDSALDVDLAENEIVTADESDQELSGSGDEWESGLGDGQEFSDGEMDGSGSDQSSMDNETAESESEVGTGSELDLELGAIGNGIQTLSLDEWNNSYIEIKVAATLPFLDTERVTVSLVPVDAADGTFDFAPRTVTIAVPDGSDGGKMASASEKFTVTPGAYKVTLQAHQFADYTQVINVEAHETARIEVCTSKVKNEGKGVSGWMRLGDVSGQDDIPDGEIDDRDIRAIMDALHANTADEICDLNANGVVDIADLQLAVQSKDAFQEATVSILSVPHRVQHDDTTAIDGLDNLLNDGGLVTLSPTNGENISEENPVSIAFDFGTLEVQDGGTEVTTGTASLEGITLQAPVERAKDGSLSSEITGGFVVVEAEENGKTVQYELPLIPGTDVPQTISAADRAAKRENISAEEQGSTAVAEQGDAPAAEQAAEQGEVTASGETASDETASEKTTDPVDTVLPVTLMAVGFPADTISIESVEEIDEVEVPAQISAEAEQTVDNGMAEGAEPTAAAEKEEVISGTLEQATSRLEPDGSFVLDFGRQVAVKRVTIKITGTKQKDQNLAEIGKVQFVNDMASRIPAPDLSIPEIQQPVIARNEELELHWTEQTNVTGYEIEISGPVKKASDQTQVVRVTGSPHTISSINDRSLINFKEYKIRIRSVNGEWSSPWTDYVTAIPAPENAPGRVDNVVTKGGFRSVQISWKDMDDSNGYMIFYREKGVGAYRPVVENYALPANGEGRLMQNSYTITGLADLTTYEVYVLGWNDYKGGSWGVNTPGVGDGPRVSEATTESGDTPRLPKYQLINTYGGKLDDKADGVVGKLTDHIVSAVCGTHNGQKMVESPIDEAKKDETVSVNGVARQHARWAYGVVDNSYSSYWIKNDWDDGVSYPVADFSKGVTVTFDDEYEMNYLSFTAADLKGSIETAKIVYWGADDIEKNIGGEAVGCSVIRCLDETNRPYYVVKFDEEVRAKQILLYIGTTYARIDLKIAEIHFHRYDEKVDGAVEALFGDSEHSCLSPELTELAQTDMAAAEAQIDAAEAIVNTKDAATGEYHPLRDFLLLDIEAARDLLELKLDEPFRVDNTITAAKDGHINFGGLNAWQPLGRVAATGDKLIVYVGHNAKSIRQNANLQLIFTQFHAESNALASTYNLKVGKNEITVPKITSTGGKERGGQLYVAYTGNDPKDQYVVRVNGGAKIPVLNYYGADDKEAAIRAYVEELDAYVDTIPSLHETLHAASENTNVNEFAYDEKNCFLNATDLMTDHMMYSVPATQVWSALEKYPTNAQKEAAVGDAMEAIEKTMTLFYQHKGLFKGAGGNKETPSRHLNIRYMQMFTGAFMYASGNHIGVEFPETKLAMSTSWNGYGWGVAHEIGHDINDPHYAIAEITNNYFAQLLTKASNEGHRTRFNYEDVYEKVTSGAIGRSPNGAVQLALYWQLHLAFDDQTEEVDGYRDDRYIFNDYQEMFDNLFFARVDTYSRNPGQAPKNKNKDLAVELKLGKDVDQNLMRLACAAAGKNGANILPFFERWGMAPDEDTRAFAAQYGDPVTDKAYYYVNDDARNYRADHKGEEESLKITGTKASVSLDEENTADNRVSLKLSTDAAHKEAVLGYEVSRSTYWRGKKQKPEVIGFKLADANGEAVYTDVIAATDNRVLYYEVRAVDKFLNYSQTSDIVSARVSTGGVLGKKQWSVETTLTAAEGQDKVLSGEDYPDGGFDGDSAPTVEYGIKKVIDGVVGDPQAGPFLGTAKADDRITIDMQQVTEVTSLKYVGGSLGNVTISVSSDGSSWVTVKECEIAASTEKGSQTIWFDAAQAEQKDYWIGTYDARYVRFIFHDARDVEIDEIDVCGPSGDDIAFEKDTAKAVGIVKEECPYGYDEDGKPLTIPAGSLFFTGSYKGNPAYNVVMLYDGAEEADEHGNAVKHGNVIGADLEADKVYAEQVILAEVPEKGNLGEVSEGKWIYFVTPPEGTDLKDKAAVKEFSERIYKGILDEGKGVVRAELYRVDNALTLEGERIVSDTAFLTLPASFGELPETALQIELPKSKQQAEQR